MRGWAFLTIGFVTVAQVLAAEIPKGSGARWEFDQVDGRVVVDVSGRGNDALVSAGLRVKGVAGYGLPCDGTTSSIP